MTRTQTLRCCNRAPNSDDSKRANNTTDYVDAIAALVALCLFLGFLDALRRSRVPTGTQSLLGRRSAVRTKIDQDTAGAQLAAGPARAE